MFEEFRYLPWSGRRFKVSQHGKVFDSTGNEMAQTFREEELKIEIEWVLGKRFYTVALLVLVAFGKLKLPDYLLDEVDVLYVDDDRSNLAPVNLLYRYKNGPLEVEDLPGFFYIPFYNGYAISRNGDLINVETKKTKVWSVSAEGGPKNQTGGYYYSRVINDDGFSKTLFLHRALCLAFKDYDNTVLSKVVNHKDGKPSNNSLDNIHWCTYLENNLHAVESGLRSQQKAVLMKDLQDGKIHSFPSIGSCARYLNNPRGDFIRWRIEKTPTKVYSDRLLFKYDDGTAWPVIDLEEVDICRFGGKSEIVARNVFTGEELLFEGTYQGEFLTGVKNSTILRHVRENSPIPINGYNFRYREFANEWPKHTARHLEVYKDYPVFPPNGVVMTDLETGAERFFTSAAKAANALNLSKHRVWSTITSGYKHKDRFILTLFDLKETLGLPTEQSVEK